MPHIYHILSITACRACTTTSTNHFLAFTFQIPANLQNSHSVLLKLLMDQLLERLYPSKTSHINSSSPRSGLTSSQRVPLMSSQAPSSGLTSSHRVPMMSSQSCNIGVFHEHLHILEHLQNYVMTRMSEIDIPDRINKYRNTIPNSKAGGRKKPESGEYDRLYRRSSKKSRNTTLSSVRRTIRV